MNSTSIGDHSNNTIPLNTMVDDQIENHYLRDVITMILYAITAIVALLGNYLVCKIVFDKNSKLKNSTNILVGNLAISDIIGGVTIPGQWIFCSTYSLDNLNLDFFCALTKSLQVLSFYMSSLIMMLIAFERYLAIVHPLSRPFNSKLYVSITWILTSLFVISSIGSAKIFEYFTGPRLISCRIVLKFTKPFNSDSLRAQRVWGIWLGQYVIPLLVTTILYIIIIHKIWTHKKVGTTVNTVEKGKSTTARDAAKKRIIIMLIIVVTVFAICWLPLHALNFSDYVIKQLEHKHKFKKHTNVNIKRLVKKSLCNDSTLYFILYWFGISSCCYNPFIYWWMNAEFREGYRKFIPKTILNIISRSTVNEDNSIELRGQQSIKHSTSQNVTDETS